MDIRARIERELQKRLNAAQEDPNCPWVDLYLLPFILMTRTILLRHKEMECACDGSCENYCNDCYDRYPCGTVKDIIGQLNMLKAIPVELDG